MTVARAQFDAELFFERGAVGGIGRIRGFLLHVMHGAIHFLHQLRAPVQQDRRHGGQRMRASDARPCVPAAYTGGVSVLERVKEDIAVATPGRPADAYLDWIRRYVRFHALRHPRELGAAEIAAYLSHPAVQGNLAASTQNQAKSDCSFLYRDVLHAGGLGLTVSGRGGRGVVSPLDR